MSESEKSFYVTEVANLDVTNKKRISRREMSLIDKNLLDFPIKAHKHQEDYAERLEKWIKRQPDDVQPILKVKFKVNSKLKKRHLQVLTQDNNQPEEPCFKKHCQESQDSKLQSEPSINNICDTKTSSNLDHLNGLSKSINKTDKLALPSSSGVCSSKVWYREPKYPSQSTAHFFTTNIYEGKPYKVAQAYNRLNPELKKKYRKQMKDKKRAFLLKAKKYITQLDQSRARSYWSKISDMKAEQQNDIKWHKSSGTDEEAESDSEYSESSSSDWDSN